MSGQVAPGDNYSDKLIKLLPAEGIAALTTIKTLLPAASTSFVWLGMSAGIVGVFVFLWARLMRQVQSGKQLAFTMTAYLLWVVNILWDSLTGSFAMAADAPAVLPAVLSILFALFIPFVFP